MVEVNESLPWENRAVRASRKQYWLELRIRGGRKKRINLEVGLGRISWELSERGSVERGSGETVQGRVHLVTSVATRKMGRSCQSHRCKWLVPNAGIFKFFISVPKQSAFLTPNLTQRRKGATAQRRKVLLDPGGNEKWRNSAGKPEHPYALRKRWPLCCSFDVSKSRNLRSYTGYVYSIAGWRAREIGSTWLFASR